MSRGLQSRESIVEEIRAAYAPRLSPRDAPRRRAKEYPACRIEYVYLIRCSLTGLVKVGFAISPSARLAQLQLGSPTKLELLTFAPGSLSQERELHRQFLTHRQHGEWFAAAATDQLLAAFCSIRYVP